MAWVWVEDDSSLFMSRWLPDGRLQFCDRHNRMAIAGGCSLNGYFDYLWHQQQVADCFASNDNLQVNPEYFVVQNEYLQQNLTRCIELSGIDPERLSISQMLWLVLDTEEKPAPLTQLNAIPEARHPGMLGSSEKMSDRVEWIASVITACNHDYVQADKVLNTIPSREVFSIIQEVAYQSQSPDKREEIRAKDNLAQGKPIANTGMTFDEILAAGDKMAQKQREKQKKVRAGSLELDPEQLAEIGRQKGGSDDQPNA